MIPLAIPNLAGKEEDYLRECVRSTYVSTVGPFVNRMEQMVADASGALYAVATSTGTAGLHTALLAVGVSRDDLVICPSLTFVATANAISHCGALPWLFDISPENWTLDPEMVDRELKQHCSTRAGQVVHTATGKRVAAILPVFTLGLPADMDKLVEVANRHNLPVVADAAAALGATYKGQPSGAIGADLTMYSFNGNKTVTAGGGGAIVGSNSTLIDRVRHLSTTARVGEEYDHDVVGFNYRMTNVQAAVGCAQLENLDIFVDAKRRIFNRYCEELSDLENIRPFPQPDWAQSACWFSGFIFDEITPGEMAILRHNLRERGIDARPFWKPMHLQKPYAMAPSTSQQISDGLWSRILTLPCSTHLTHADQTHIISIIRELVST